MERKQHARAHGRQPGQGPSALAVQQQTRTTADNLSHALPGRSLQDSTHTPHTSSRLDLAALATTAASTAAASGHLAGFAGFAAAASASTAAAAAAAAAPTARAAATTSVAAAVAALGRTYAASIGDATAAMGYLGVVAVDDDVGTTPDRVAIKEESRVCHRQVSVIQRARGEQGDRQHGHHPDKYRVHCAPRAPMANKICVRSRVACAVGGSGPLCTTGACLTVNGRVGARAATAAAGPGFAAASAASLVLLVILLHTSPARSAERNHRLYRQHHTHTDHAPWQHPSSSPPALTRAPARVHGPRALAAQRAHPSPPEAACGAPVSTQDSAGATDGNAHSRGPAWTTHCTNAAQPAARGGCIAPAAAAQAALRTFWHS